MWDAAGSIPTGGTKLFSHRDVPKNLINFNTKTPWEHCENLRWRFLLVAVVYSNNSTSSYVQVLRLTEGTRFTQTIYIQKSAWNFQTNFHSKNVLSNSKA